MLRRSLVWQEDMADSVVVAQAAVLSGLSLSLSYYYASVVVVIMMIVAAVLAPAN